MCVSCQKKWLRLLTRIQRDKWLQIAVVDGEAQVFVYHYYLTLNNENDIVVFLKRYDTGIC